MVPTSPVLAQHLQELSSKLGTVNIFRLPSSHHIKRHFASPLPNISRLIEAPTAKKEAQNVNELMDLFLSEMSNDTTLSDYARKKANADTFFKAYDLTLRTKKIMNNRRLRKHYDSKYAAQSASRFELHGVGRL